MRYLLLVAILGCADDSTLPGSKSEAECADAWKANGGKCDLACEAPVQLTGDACETGLTVNGSAFSCSLTFESNGETGCCLDVSGTKQPSMIAASDSEPARSRTIYFLSCK